MVKKIFMISMALIAAGGILFAAGCRHRCVTPEKRAEWIVDKIKNKLDLSDTQVTEVNKIKDEILAKKDDFRDIRKSIYDTVLKEVQSDKFDVNAVNQAFAERDAKVKELRTFMIGEAAKFHAILTPEQRAKLAKLMEERHNCYGK